jgi:GT2 family glycosyltransferase
MLTLRHSEFKEPIYEYRFHSASLTHKDVELGITRNRNKLMVFDDFRRDFCLTPFVWIIDQDNSNNQVKKVVKRLSSFIDRAGHILVEHQKQKLSVWPRLWVPSVYLKITDDPYATLPSPETLPTNMFTVMLNISKESMPDTLDAKWDLCMAYQSNSAPPQLDQGRRGWITSNNIQVLFSTIDIRVRSRHLNLIEAEISQPRSSKFKISVIICTYQRGKKLVETLNAIINQTLPHEDYEVIVVNNDPNDLDFPNLFAEIHSQEFADHPDHFRILLCPILGLSHARNAGIAEARGEILLFLDDDSIAQENVLESYWKVFSKHPTAGVVGGHILVHPPYPLKIPWKKGFERYWSQFVTGYTDYTEVSNWWEFPWGANWCARRNALISVGGFRGQFGRRGNDYSGGEEIVAASLIEKLGYSIAVLPQAVVIHQVEAKRFTLKHLKRTIRAGLFAQYDAQKKLYLPNETTVGNSSKQIIENLIKLVPALLSSNPNKKADLYETYFYSLARWQLVIHQITDSLRRIRRPISRK